jgi:tetratricopeptide (TPR) repeat protein
MQLFDQGIAQYEALVKEGANPDTIRDLAASVLRRGQVNLMRTDPRAAIVDFHHARDSTARLLKLDPKNEMLQSDVCGFDHDEGRALVVSGMAAQGLVLLQRSLQCFHNLHLEADTGPGTGAMEAWIGEAQASSHNLPEALKHYQTAAAALAADIDKYDDARCDLAMVETKIANTLLHMGRLREASEHYAKALDLSRLPFSLEDMDIPALYAAADAYSGLGNVAAAKAQNTQGPGARSALENISRRAYADSLNVWKQIPNPSPINPNGYLVGEPQQMLSAAAARLGVQAAPK